MRVIKFFVRKRIDTMKPIRSTSKKVAMLGFLYPIKIVDGAKNKVKVTDDHLEVTLFPATKVNFENYLEGWYRRQARSCFYKAVDKWMPDFERLGYDIPYPQLKIFNMTRAWGRCYYTKGVITLNLRLFSVPQECVEHIVLHELAHFVAHDHGPLFHAVLDKVDPDWRSKQARLRQIETNFKQTVP